jgi:hypothetical protein
MAEAAALKKQCSTAKAKFTRKSNILSEMINSGSDVSQINACFDDVNNAWQFLEQKHDQYVDLIPEGEETLTTAEEWITNIQTKYNSFRQSVISLRSQAELNKVRDAAKRLCTMQEANFDKMRKNIETLVSQKYLPETLVYERTLLVFQFEKFTEVHSAYLAVAPEEICPDLLTKMSHHIERFNHVKSLN